MRFAIGYQLPDPGEEPFVDLVAEYRDHIAEVYFPWAQLPSGRSALGGREGCTDWTAQARLEEDLRALRKMGVRLDLLFNANCFGGQAISAWLENQVGSRVEHLGEGGGGVDVVTTTSLAVGRTVKKHFPGIEVRASVNMRIGTVQAMEMVAGLFDSFCVQRDYNRDLEHLHDLRSWADRNGKGLLMLANSGCLRLCPGQTFHDNLVAHEAEVAETRNIADWTPHVCWNFFRKRENWPAVLQSTWVRPEDLWRYEKIFPVVKLATRMHGNPRMVIHAYVNRGFRGNLLDLFEPGFSRAFAPHLVDNTRFPADWFEKTSSCDRACHRCDFCLKTLEQVLVESEA
ncbi:hypothetical protein HQ520_13290 [bacterium]|nr:hypothetical protein [bacterium]